MQTHLARIVLIMFMFVGGAVHADDVKSELNYIKSSLDQAESRIKDNNVGGGSSFMRSAKRSMETASPATKASADFAKLQARFDDLEKKLGVIGAAAERADDADKELREADSQKSFGEMKEGDEGLPLFQSCLQHVDAAVKADPSVEAKAAPIRKACKDGLKQAQDFAKGGGRTAPDETELGKDTKAGLLAAMAVLKKKDLEAFDLIDGQKAAKQCLNGLNSLESTVISSRNNKKLYDFNKHTFTLPEGAITLGEARKRCTAIMEDLGKRKVKGCGTKGLLVTQPLVATHPERWGKSAFSVEEEFEPAKCAEMPKAAQFPGSSRGIAGSFKGMCKGGVVVMDDAGWTDPSAATDGSLFHAMSGKCWMKGKLNFKLP